MTYIDTIIQTNINAKEDDGEPEVVVETSVTDLFSAGIRSRRHRKSACGTQSYRDGPDALTLNEQKSESESFTASEMSTPRIDSTPVSKGV